MPQEGDMATKPPPKLSAKARRLWTETTTAFTLREDELCVLEDACRELDLVARMEAEVAKSGLVVEGSQGQPVSSPLVTEIRQHRTVMARLLQSLKLPEDAESAEAERAKRSATMREVANARWKRGA